MAYRQAAADCGLQMDENLICYGNSMENSAQSCMEHLLEQKCDAIVVCQGIMAAETVIQLHRKGIRMAEDLDLVSFVDYESDSDATKLYTDRMDCIIQPVEELGRAAGEQILNRIEQPELPAFEKVLTSSYKPYSNILDSNLR